MKKLLAMLLAVVLVVCMFAGCAGNNDPVVEDTTGATDGETTTTQGGTTNEQTTTGDTTIAADVVVEEPTYTYLDSVSTMATNWNPHTYQTSDDAYPADFLRVGLYSFIFNDELHPVEGKDPYTGYVIVPEMAASEPVDVTEQVKAEHPEFNIPESATSGYAYTIDLNPNAVWEDGTPINADTYVYSMQRLLDVNLLNYRASDYYAGDFCIAGAEGFANSGLVSKLDNGIYSNYNVEDLTKGEDGVYYTPDGGMVYIAIDYALDWCGGNTLKDYVDAYGTAYFDVTNWDALVALMDEDGLIPLTDENLALFTPVTCGNPAWGETEADLFNYYIFDQAYAEVDYSTVGLYKTGEYQITLVLGKSLSGFYLLYNLSGNWIVYEDLYESCLKEENGVWSSTYNTSVETTLSYGPYKMTEYQTDKHMRFEKNETWYGWTDGQHVYVDPVDGETYDMYQTTAIDCQVVSEAATRKQMFLSGQLMGYGLQSDDFATYRNSDYVYFTPGGTIFFLILNGYKEAIEGREAAADFDQTTTDLESMLLLSFRQAVAVTYDKELFASTVSPARSGGYGIIGSAYVYDPDSGSLYRDTDQAKQALCDFYSVDVAAFGGDLDAAVDSITGYDPETAKELFIQAFAEALAAGYVTDNDGDGICDQTVTIEYSLSSDSDFMTTTIDYLNEKMNEVTAGTPYEGKILFKKSAPYGNDWSTKLKSGLADTCLAGWSGSLLNPYSLSDLYVNPSYQYDAEWFDASTVDMTLTIDGVEITMNLRQWSDALNGATVTVDGVDYNFGDGHADVDVRLSILAGIETHVLMTYNYIPMLQDASAALLSQQVFYVVDDYNPVMGRGGIAYMKYNYSDAEWADYVASCGGTLQY